MGDTFYCLRRILPVGEEAFYPTIAEGGLMVAKKRLDKPPGGGGYTNSQADVS